MLLAVFPLSPLCTVVSIFAISRAQKETRRSAILRYKFAERQWNIRRDNDAVGGVWEISPGSQTIVVIVAGNLRHCQWGGYPLPLRIVLVPRRRCDRSEKMKIICPLSKLFVNIYDFC